MNSGTKQRIIIYGAGAIGGALGGHLALAGTEVLLIGRSRHIDIIRQTGLRFITPNGTHILKPAAFTAPNQIDFQPDDLIFLCMKSQDTEAALRDLQAVVKDIPIFSFQNSVRNEETASKYFPRVYGAMIRIGCEYVKDGEVLVRRDPPGWVVTGCYPHGTDALAESTAAKLRQSGFHVLVTPDVMPYKWGKLMLNLTNAIGAITNEKGEENGRIAQAPQKEAQEILKLAGIRWISNEELSQQWSEINLKPRKVISTEAQSSTWQSLARQQGTVETDYLNGEIVRLAQRLGKKAPINEALMRITQEMAAKHEKPGKYSSAELMRMMGI